MENIKCLGTLSEQRRSQTQTYIEKSKEFVDKLESDRQTHYQQDRMARSHRGSWETRPCEFPDWVKINSEENKVRDEFFAQLRKTYPLVNYDPSCREIPKSKLPYVTECRVSDIGCRESTFWINKSTI